MNDEGDGADISFTMASRYSMKFHRVLAPQLRGVLKAKGIIAIDQIRLRYRRPWRERIFQNGRQSAQQEEGNSVMVKKSKTPEETPEETPAPVIDDTAIFQSRKRTAYSTVPTMRMSITILRMTVPTPTRITCRTKQNPRTTMTTTPLTAIHSCVRRN